MASTSPAPQRTTAHVSNTLDFPAAMAEVIAGHKITKLEWGDPSQYGVLKDGLLMIRLTDGWHKWIVNDGDLLGTDWITI
jgi:hypothetical protein